MKNVCLLVLHAAVLFEGREYSIGPREGEVCVSKQNVTHSVYTEVLAKREIRGWIYRKAS